ncbi:MAG: rhomboid family intramembrane serine protease [Synechococcaceae cyanobacterium]
MGKGEELGHELRRWITVDRWLPPSGPALANRLIDLLGEQDTLKAPLRDLAGQPQFLQLLRQPQPASPAAVEVLCALLARTYAPAVLGELQDLVHVATGLQPNTTVKAAAAGSCDAEPLPGGQALLSWAGDRGAATAPLQTRERIALDGFAERAAPLASSAAAEEPPVAPGPSPTSRRWRGLAEELTTMGPGLALGFSVSLVLTWAAAQLDRTLLDSWGWSGGVTLAVTLLALQVGTSGPLRRLRRRALLSLPSSGEPRLAWRWFTAPWLHARGGEALTHVLLLLILLGPSPLPLNQVVLRYSLTGLATQALAVLSARLSGMTLRRWGGSAGPVASLIGLAATLSLLQWRELGFRVGLPGQLSVPAWVLLVIYASLQLAWQLPSTGADDTSRPGDRLWSSTWWWGTLLGAGWGLLTWSLQAIAGALRHSGGG